MKEKDLQHLSVPVLTLVLLSLTKNVQVKINELFLYSIYYLLRCT